MVSAFEDEDGRALAEDESVTVGVEGRQACSGRSVRVDRARIRAKHAAVARARPDSQPPVRTMSQAPLRSRSRATPMAVVPDAQALDTVKLGPRAPVSMATSPATMLGTLRGSASGETDLPGAMRVNSLT